MCAQPRNAGTATMEQQDNAASRDARPPGEASPPERSPEAREPNGDGTWGQGSATALESLRRQNFRGKREAVEGERPRS